MAQLASAKWAEINEVSISWVMLKPVTRGSSPKNTTCVSPYRRIWIRSHRIRTNSRMASASCIRPRSHSYKSILEETPQYSFESLIESSFLSFFIPMDHQCLHELCVKRRVSISGFYQISSAACKKRD